MLFAGISQKTDGFLHETGESNMKYERIKKAFFIERPNRFIAYVEADGRREKVHVKNTGRCAELLLPGTTVYIEKSENPSRKTKWDLTAVEKGKRLINMDSQIPNKVVQEFIESRGMFQNITVIQPEKTYGNSRFDLYLEADGRKIFIEVKGVTLEDNGICMFPDAPSERAVKHLGELIRAHKEGYETYVFFVIQMKDVKYFTPNKETHPEFALKLREAAEAGVHILAYDCHVTPESISIRKPVEIVLGSMELKEAAQPLVEWYRKNKRDLPWRKNIGAYNVWISEIMLQQTRVEAVRPYYERFLKELPNVKALAEVSEDRLLKLWEGLGYYSRARNLKEAARQIVEKYNGSFPRTYDEILSLKGIGKYTAGAVSSIAFGIPKPAVDGNVLRVITRITEDGRDVMKESVRRDIEKTVEEVIPPDAPGDFNQSLIELGAIVCMPNSSPKCSECPAANICRAHKHGCETDFPVKKKSAARRIVKRTILIFRDNEKVLIRKRPSKGLLAGMYEFPGLERHLDREEVVQEARKIGLMPVRVRKLRKAKHIFSHVEWQMTGYEILVDELEPDRTRGMIFADINELKENYPMPSAFHVYLEILYAEQDEKAD